MVLVIVAVVVVVRALFWPVIEKGKSEAFVATGRGKGEEGDDGTRSSWKGEKGAGKSEILDCRRSSCNGL